MTLLFQQLGGSLEGILLSMMLQIVVIAVGTYLGVTMALNAFFDASSGEGDTVTGELED